MVESTPQMQKQMAEQDPEKLEREVSRRYQVMQQEVKALMGRLMELEEEQKENQ